MVKIPQNISNTDGSARELCINKFKEWWTVEELSNIVSQMDPGVLRMFAERGEKISNPDRLAEIIYDAVGPRFLRTIDNDIKKRQKFLSLIFEYTIPKKIIAKQDIITAAKSIVHPSKKGSIKEIDDVIALDATQRWCSQLAFELGLPPSVAEKERIEHPPQTEIIEPHSPLNPLYDYQYTTGLFVRDMLEGQKIENNKEIKRKLIAVPTGSGKTRMVVETLITWLNDGKPSKNTQQKNSKFILWIAQSGELCEQALSTFRSVFESFGQRGTTLHLHRFWGKDGALPTLGMDDLLDEKGVIIATIQSLYKILKQPGQLEKLAELTSCIIIDEAHHSIADSYSSVLRKMGFNWDNRKKEISELGIILLGLTATPFRGAGYNDETERLKRRYNGVYFPTIPYFEEIKNYKPHALIDCQTFAHVDDDVRILGERSYDRDGYINNDGYLWKIIKQKKFIELYSKNKDDLQPNEWVFEKSKNITFKFPEPGEYKIILKVVDNEGDYGTAKSFISIKKRPAKSNKHSLEIQKQLYQKLIKRKILCDVYHKILKSKSIQLDLKGTKHLEKFGEFGKGTLKQIGENTERNLMILNEISQLKKSGKKKILFFGCSVEHSRNIAKFLKIFYEIKVRYVDSKMDLDSRVDAIEQFRNGNLDVLCNFDVLSAGFDAPKIDCVFIGRPIKSTLLYTQMIGRGMRGTKSGGTEDVILVDIDDNFQLQGQSYDSSITELGWKIYKEYWKTWEDSENEVQAKPKLKAEPKVFSHTCSQCKITAEGIESIKKIFGIEGPTEILIDYLQKKNYDQLPAKCRQCRDNETVSVKASNRKELKKPIKTEFTSKQIDKKFEYLRHSVYGHIPTTRQFNESMDPEIKETINKQYGSYDGYLKAKNLLIKEDPSLADKLYDEYFELYHKVERLVDQDMLDHHGDYRISDYVECFGSSEKFDNIVEELICRIKNINQKITRKDIYRDYAEIKNKLGAEPHFDEVRVMSNFGIEYYIGLFGSLGLFKANWKIDEEI